MSENIIPHEINDYNDSIIPKLLSFDHRSTDVFINTPGDYEVKIEKMKLPLTNIPIINNANWSIIYESTDKNVHPTTIPGADFRKTQFSDSFLSINQFCSIFNSQIEKNLTPSFTFGSLSYSTDTQRLTWEESDKVAQKQYVKIWVDFRIAKLFAGLPLLESQSFKGVLHYSLSGSKHDAPGVYTQYRSSAKEFYGIVSLRARSNLPTAPYTLTDNAKHTIEKSNVLTTIDFITAEMIDNDVIVYHPPTFRHYSLGNSQPLSGYKVTFTVYYANGEEKEIYLHQGEHASLNITFVKK